MSRRAAASRASLSLTVHPLNRQKIEKNAAEAKEETTQEIEAEALAMQQTSLTCIQCRLDGTVPFKTQNLVYTHSQLNKHLKSNFHARREQVRRAFNIDKNYKGQCECPCCPAGDGRKMYLQKAFLAHMESEHGASMDF